MSVGPAEDKGSPLFRLTGVMETVLTTDGNGGYAKWYPGKNCFVVTSQAPRTDGGYYLRCEVVGGPECGRPFLIDCEWDCPEEWDKMCSFVG
jgi:hypothetical protein